MTARMLSRIPPSRRARLLEGIRQMLAEYDAMDRSLRAVGEPGLAGDDVLYEIIGRLNVALGAAKRRKRAA